MIVINYFIKKNKILVANNYLYKMKFGCSNCDYVAFSKDSVRRHINKKNKCGTGAAKILEIPFDIICKYCDKKFETKANLIYHQTNNCVKKSSGAIAEINTAKMAEELKILKEKVKQMELEKNQTHISSNTTNNITQVIVLNNYDETSLSKLTDKLINELILDADETYKIIPSLIKHVHFNPETPENHNICLPNKNSNNKYMNVFREGQWQAAIKNTEVDNIISDKETQLGDWVTEKGKKFPEAKEKYEDYLEQKYEPDIAKLIKEEVELILYNGRHMIKNQN